MKLPVIRHLQRNNDVEKLQHTIDVIENYTEHRSVSNEELDLLGELLTNLCGAVEVHKMIEAGTPETEAANNFVKKVLGSIDR